MIAHIALVHYTSNGPHNDKYSYLYRPIYYMGCCTSKSIPGACHNQLSQLVADGAMSAVLSDRGPFLEARGAQEVRVTTAVMGLI